MNPGFRTTIFVLRLSALVIIGISSASGADEGANDINGKCLTPYLIRWRDNPGRYPQLQRLFDQRPQLDSSIVSPSGRFRIHFDTSAGSRNLPALVTADGVRMPNTSRQYVDSIASIFDSVWHAEIETDGFNAPISDGGAGGGPEYDIYINDLGANNFGYTQPDTTAAFPPGNVVPVYSSYIVVDNDFGTGFRTIGLDGAKVTAAHEFFHAIQVGGYGLWGSSEFYFYELSAESMESHVFPSVKDYVNDIPRYFSNIENVPLYSDDSFYPGYERAIWGVYLRLRFGIVIWKSIWTEIEQKAPFPALAAALADYSSSVGREFAQFSLWNYYTGPRADTVSYYPDGSLFPSLAFADNVILQGGTTTIQHASKSFVSFYERAVNESDTTDIVVTNVNAADALASSHGSYGFTVMISPQSIGGWTSLSNGMSVRWAVDDPANWLFRPLTLLKGGGPFPNPFRPAFDAIYFPVPASAGESTVTVYDASMSRVADFLQVPFSFLGRKCVSWNGLDSRGRRIASGIYFYVINGTGVFEKGKFAVIQ